MEKVRYDFKIFDQMTKEEIIYWIKSEAIHYFSFKAPTKTNLAWIRYVMAQEILRKESSDLIYELERIGSTGWAKKHDALAIKFNKEKDIQLKQKILEEMEILKKDFYSWMKKDKQHSKKYEESQKLYKIYQDYSEEETLEGKR